MQFNSIKLAILLPPALFPAYGPKLESSEHYTPCSVQVLCLLQFLSLVVRPKSHLFYGEDAAAVPP